MDFDWSTDQEDFRRAVLQFATTHLGDDGIEADREGRFDAQAWKRCADFGIQGLNVPEEYGGQGADALTIAVAFEALGYACRDNGLLFSLGAQIWSCQSPLVRFGSEEQKRRYLPGLVDGSLVGVQGMTEPGSGSDAFSLGTTARATGAGYVLNGSKTFITNAPVADVFVVFASTNPERRSFGLSAFVVDRDTPGLEVGRTFDKMGLRTSPMSELRFDDCTVPVEALLGKEGAGMAVFNHSMEWERGLILAHAIGTMQRQLEQSVDYAKQRTQFGESIGSFQAVSHRLVDMRVRIESARLLLYRMAWSKSQGRKTGVDAAMVKLVISEAWLQSSLDALQTRGGYGFMTETGIERDVRDAIASRIYSGTSDMQRNMIARDLGL